MRLTPNTDSKQSFTSGVVHVHSDAIDEHMGMDQLVRVGPRFHVKSKHAMDTGHANS